MYTLQQQNVLLIWQAVFKIDPFIHKVTIYCNTTDYDKSVAKLLAARDVIADTYIDEATKNGSCNDIREEMCELTKIVVRKGIPNMYVRRVINFIRDLEPFQNL